ncbi:zinc-binding dehydrogenase [Aliiglaciecola sp. CAU 1673]|uniref:zinc-binding dehydrogenase n=1 Tax=Aliiglaciecola sp. CAU 1673 TaxID=3032595 RepID=UPI0023D97B42|nr:zinc-binding dehydrogenase [Aliiglaciecola sp. CAU 1673]MDF2177846.1 zinc-binding dehydrogenase [Aliiglaciecola sp. CAU 1673]
MTTTNSGFALKLIDDPEAGFAERLQRLSKPMPSPKPGHVLIKMLASPVNPSDLVYLRGQYGLPPKDNTFAGFEGCGLVVDANAGLYGKWLKGKRVAVAAQPGIDGVWAQYACTLASYCLPVRDDIDDAQAATLIVNPCTVVCLLDRAKALGAKAVVINAAASQVGKGLIRYAQRLNIKTIATVRSETNLNVVRNLGATHALLTTDQDFSMQLKAAVEATGATVLLDAVAEKETPRVLKQMPQGSTAILYGRLEETHDPLGGHFSVADVIFRDIRIEGFWLARTIKNMPIWRVIQMNRRVQQLFAEGIFHTDIRGQYGFDSFLPALEHYAEHKSDGKVILRPWD